MTGQAWFPLHEYLVSFEINVALSSGCFMYKFNVIKCQHYKQIEKSFKQHNVFDEMPLQEAPRLTLYRNDVQNFRLAF